MKIFVTGATGKLGTEFIKIAINKNYDIYSYSKLDLDISIYEDVKYQIHKVKPDVILNFAAYVNADKAEQDIKCFSANSIGPQFLARCAKEVGAKLCHISTAFVFDGLKDFGLSYSEKDETNPINEYGKSKLIGEDLIRFEMDNYFIIRTNWLFGSENDFLAKMISGGIKNKEIFAINNQYGSFTSISDLSNFCLEIINTDYFGIYNYTNAEYATPYDFIKEAIDYLNLDIKIKKISDSDFNFIAKRPKNSCLNLDKTISIINNPPRAWRDALKDCLDRIYI